MARKILGGSTNKVSEFNSSMLSEEEIKYILDRKPHLIRSKLVCDRFFSGETLDDIARDMNISPGRVWQIKHNWQWRIGKMVINGRKKI